MRPQMIRRGVLAAAVLAAVPVSASAAGFSGASIPRQTDKANASNRSVAIRVSCPKGTVKGCFGTLSLKTAQKVNGRIQSLGSAKFSVQTGRTSKVNLNLNAEGQKLIKRGKITPVAVASSRDGRGHKATQSRKITLESHNYVPAPIYGGY